MENNLFNRFEEKDANVIESKCRTIPGSISMFSKAEEQAIQSIQVFDCNGAHGMYKALKIVYTGADGKLKELSPWPTLDMKSQWVEHLVNVEPKYVRLYQTQHIETGKIFNKVRLMDWRDQKVAQECDSVWSKRTF